MIKLITLSRVEGGFVLDSPQLSAPIPAAIGVNGLIPAAEKREGDGKTPIGTWPMRQLFYRPDRITLPKHQFSATEITQQLGQQLGWCDDAEDPFYNQLVKLPFAPSHEKLWRQDHAYDLIIPLGYNDAPAKPHLGSAIFFHLLHDGKDSTAGCIAISRDHMLGLIPYLSGDSFLEITA